MNEKNEHQILYLKSAIAILLVATFLSSLFLFRLMSRLPKNTAPLKIYYEKNLPTSPENTPGNKNPLTPAPGDPTPVNTPSIPKTSSETGEEKEKEMEKENLLLDINTATREELMELPGIGEKMADGILETRKQMGGFQSEKDLLEVPGIGEKRFKRLEPFLKKFGNASGKDRLTPSSESHKGNKIPQKKDSSKTSAPDDSFSLTCPRCKSIIHSHKSRDSQIKPYCPSCQYYLFSETASLTQ